MRQCIACPAGHYKEEKGNANCLACAEHAHSVTASTSKADCLCKSGYTGDDGGPCTACSIGKYKTRIGSEACVHCWPHSTNLAVASNNSLHCFCNAGYELIDNQCQKCHPGSYKSTVSSDSCNQHCPSYSISAAGSTSISDCECNAGYFGVAANAQCTACAAGTYKSDIGSSECLACTANATTLSIANVDTSDCLCKLGFYSSHACKILFTEECICTECSENFYGTHFGCIPCPPNTHSQPASNDISMCKCNAGFTKTGVNLHTQAPICSSCPVGTYSISGEEENCLHCPKNSSTMDIGASRVSQCLCLPGFILNSTNGECEICPANTFQQSYPNGLCTSCPTHSISDPGSTSKLDCVCSAGYSSAAGGECWECQEGKYKDIVGSAACSICPAYTSSPKASTQKTKCTCLPGYVGLPGSPCLACQTSTYEINGVCVLCPQHTFAPIASTTVESCKCKQGFVASDMGICKPCAFGFYRADNDDTCVACGIMSNTTHEGSGHKSKCLCNPGYSTIEQTIKKTDDGTLCEECPENTYKSTLGTQSCTPCPANSVAPVASSTMSACKCLAGFIEAGDGTCDKVCAPGYEPLLQETCVGCAFNYYKSSSGNDKCLPCSPYSFTVFPNATRASDCICQEGFMWNSETLKCDMCPPGYFNNEANSSACYPCVTNCHESLETEETSLNLLLSFSGSNTQCPGLCRIPPGFELSKDLSASRIVRCATNHFQDGTATQCTQCPSPSTYSVNDGLTSIFDCSCRPGYFRLAGSCTACPKGSFKTDLYNEHDDAFPCESCPANMYTLLPASTHISDCKCMPGYNLVNGLCTPILCPENSVLHIVDHVAECQCKPGFETYTFSDNWTCSACSDGAYKETIGFHKCLTCGANTRSTLPRNNITSCFCQSGYEPQYGHGPDILGGLCVPECAAGNERVHGSCKPCTEIFFKKQTDRACMPCPSPRTRSQRQSTHEDQCYCPVGTVEIEQNAMVVVQQLGHMMPESKQYLKAENFLLYKESIFGGAELLVSGNVRTHQIEITVADRVIFYCGRGSCQETIINLNGMRGTLKAVTNTSVINTSSTPHSTNQSQVIFSLSWFTRRQVIFTGQMQPWWPAALVKAQAWAAAGQIQKGDTIFQNPKLYSFNKNTCSLCPQKLMCA